MKNGMRTFSILLAISHFIEVTRSLGEEGSTPVRGRRRPFGYVVKGSNHVAAFQMGSLDDGLFAHLPRFSSEGIHRGGAFAGDELTNLFRNLAGNDPRESEARGKSPTSEVVPLPLNDGSLLYSRSPVLGEKDAPAFTPGNVIVPRIDSPSNTAPPPPASNAPSAEILPSTPPSTLQQKSQYSVIDHSAPEVTNLFNPPRYPALNPLYPFSRTLHNYPEIVTPGQPQAGSSPTANPPFPTTNFVAFPESVIEPTTTSLHPTYTPFPRSPPLVPPSRTSVSPIIALLPKGTFFWYKLNNKNFTFVPNYADFIKRYQNPLLFTRPMQNSLFRPFLIGGKTPLSHGPTTRFHRTNQASDYIPNYFPAPSSHFPFDIPFLKAEDENPLVDRRIKQLTTYPSPAGGASPTPSVKVTRPGKTFGSGSASGKDSDSMSEGDSEKDSDPASSSDSNKDFDSDSSKRSNSDPVLNTTSDGDSGSTEEPHPFLDAPSAENGSDGEKRDSHSNSSREASISGEDASDNRTKEPEASLIPLGSSTPTDEQVADGRRRSFDQTSNGSERSSDETTPMNVDNIGSHDSEDTLSVRRAVDSSQDNEDYDPFFVDFMSKPISMDQDGKLATESAQTSTLSPPEITTAEPPPTTTTNRFEDFDGFVDLHASETPITKTVRMTTITKRPFMKAPATTETASTEIPFKINKATTRILTVVKAEASSTTTTKPFIMAPTEPRGTPTTDVTEPTTKAPTNATTTTTTKTTTTTTTTTATTEAATTSGSTKAASTTSVNEETTPGSIVPVPTPEREELSTTTEYKTNTTEVTESEVSEGISTSTALESMTTTSVTDGVPESESTTGVLQDGATTTSVQSETPTTESTLSIPEIIEDETAADSMTTITASAVTGSVVTTNDKHLGSTVQRSTTTTEMASSSVATASFTETMASASDTGPSTSETVTVSTEEGEGSTVFHETVESSSSSAAPESGSVLTDRSQTTEQVKTAKNDEMKTIGDIYTDSSVDEANLFLQKPRLEARSSKTLRHDSSEPQESTTAPSTSVTPDEDATATSASPTTKIHNTMTLDTVSTVASTTDANTASSTQETTSNTETVEATTPAQSSTKLGEAEESTVDEEMSSFPTTEAPVEERRVNQTEVEERRKRVPDAVFVGGRNYSEVQRSHPVVNDIDASDGENRKVRRAATWFIWLLDRERIATDLVKDVRNFASSQDIIYVLISFLLILSMFSLMGLFCTLQQKK